MKVSNAGIKRMWGSLFFGFFLLAKEKKEARLSGETDSLQNSTTYLKLTNC
jgi:hypothetical protein